MEEKQEEVSKEVGFDQYQQALLYIKGFLKLSGGQYPLFDDEIEKAKKTWPKDVVAALETVDEFQKQADRIKEIY